MDIIVQETIMHKKDFRSEHKMTKVACNVATAELRTIRRTHHKIEVFNMLPIHILCS